MKKVFLFSAIGVALLFVSCKKNNDGSPYKAKSRWTFDSVTHTATSASYEENSNELFAYDTSGNFIRVFFSSGVKPTQNAHLVVLDYAATFTNFSQCSLQVGNMYDSNPIQPLSTGKPGDTVVLTISLSGKLTAAFSDISVSNGSIIKTVSGTLVEQ